MGRSGDFEKRANETKLFARNPGYGSLQGLHENAVVELGTKSYTSAVW